MGSGEASIWNPRTLLELSADTKRIEERFTASDGQNLFTLTDFTYVPDTGSLAVYRNGLFLKEGTDWAEGSNGTSFTLVLPATAGDRVVAVGYVAITGNVDVRDTDIYVSNYQAIRDYAGTEITLYSQGKSTIGDGGEDFYHKITGAAPGFYVDDDDLVIVPTGGDGSIGWVKKADRSIPVDVVSVMTGLQGMIAGVSVVQTSGFSTTNIGGGIYDCVLTSGVTPNAYNIIVGVADPLVSFQLRPESQVATYEARTWFIDQASGTDAFGKGVSSGAGAFKTMQFAWDSLPAIITDQQTMQMADDTYNINNATVPKSAVFFARGKFLASRTKKNGSNLEGSVVFKGNSSNPENVIIEPDATNKFGIYIGQGQVAFQDMTIKSASGLSANDVDSLATSHRSDSYLHMLNVFLDGRAKSVTEKALVTEGGASLEFTANATLVTINNCQQFLTCTSMADRLTASGKITMDGCDTGLSASDGGRISYTASGTTGQVIQNASLNIVNAQNGSLIEVRGFDDSNHISLDGSVQVWSGATLDLIFADVVGTTDIKNGAQVKFNNSDFQDQLGADNADVWFSNSDSFISPAVANDNAKPVVLRNSSRKYEDGTNNFNGSGGLSLHFGNVIEQTVSADATVITITDENPAVNRVNASSTDRSACTLPAGKYQGQRLILYSTGGNFTEIVESTTATISNNAVRLSGSAAADEYQGVEFIWRTDRWVEYSRSRAGA